MLKFKPKRDPDDNLVCVNVFLNDEWIGMIRPVGRWEFKGFGNSPKFLKRVDTIEATPEFVQDNLAIAFAHETTKVRLKREEK